MLLLNPSLLKCFTDPKTIEASLGIWPENHTIRMTLEAWSLIVFSSFLQVSLVSWCPGRRYPSKYLGTCSFILNFAHQPSLVWFCSSIQLFLVMSLLGNIIKGFLASSVPWLSNDQRVSLLKILSSSLHPIHFYRLAQIPSLETWKLTIE